MENNLIEQCESISRYPRKTYKAKYMFSGNEDFHIVKDEVLRWKIEDDVNDNSFDKEGTQSWR